MMRLGFVGDWGAIIGCRRHRARAVATVVRGGYAGRVVARALLLSSTLLPVSSCLEPDQGEDIYEQSCSGLGLVLRGCELIETAGDFSDSCVDELKEIRMAHSVECSIAIRDYYSCAAGMGCEKLSIPLEERDRCLNAQNEIARVCPEGEGSRV